MDYPRLSVVLPCFNEADVLLETYSRLVAACEAVVGDSFELVMVNDGSTDVTWEIIKGLVAKDDRVVGYSLSRNFGQQMAVHCGLDRCSGERVLLIDADLQDPPELLGPMMSKMDEGYDVVYGQRERRDGESKLKLLRSAAFYRVMRNMTGDFKLPLDTGDFRLMSRRVVEAFKQMPEQQRFNRGLISWIGYKQAGLLYRRDPRRAGETKWNASQLIRLAIDAITGFSIEPLRFAIHMGLLSLMVSAGLSVYAIASWVAGYAVEGWTSLMAAIIFFGSIQLFVLGIIGEYVGRILIEAKRRPLYFVADAARQSSKVSIAAE